MKIRDASIEELVQPRKPKVLSARQLAVVKREQAIEKVLNELGAGPASMIKKIELDEGEKLTTIRASVRRVMKRTASSAKMITRGGVIFLSRGVLPGGRGRPPSRAEELPAPTPRRRRKTK